MNIQGKQLLIIMALGLTHPGVIAETATVIRDTSIYQRPSSYSPVLRKLPAGTEVDEILRSGGWKQVKIDGASGWVRSYHVRTGEVPATITTESDSGGFLGGLADLSRRASSLFTVRNDRKSYQRTATIGVRGLSEEQIKNAKPDYAQMSLMESKRSNKWEALKFAQQARLNAVRLNHMPASDRER